MLVIFKDSPWIEFSGCSGDFYIILPRNFLCFPLHFSLLTTRNEYEYRRKWKRIGSLLAIARRRVRSNVIIIVGMRLIEGKSDIWKWHWRGIRKTDCIQNAVSSSGKGMQFLWTRIVRNNHLLFAFDDRTCTYVKLAKLRVCQPYATTIDRDRLDRA